MWQFSEREFSLYCELESGADLLWLEWNERVFAYRCGLVRGGMAHRSHLGFADSLEQAQKIALELLEL